MFWHIHAKLESIERSKKPPANQIAAFYIFFLSNCILLTCFLFQVIYELKQKRNDKKIFVAQFKQKLRNKLNTFFGLVTSSRTQKGEKLIFSEHFS